jgi:ABC-type multidrug transport system fused ATPase/permease subunit
MIAISVTNYSFVYFIFFFVDMKVDGGGKIGVCGRTGSGKSSMMVSLFRIEEIINGQILIDDIDISTVPLSILRSKLGIIPQDPVMFSMSVRFNLDPFNKYTDNEIWNALACVNMKAKIETLSNNIYEEVAEGGDNFSAGERQLLCIARALLRKPKILILDEATASIDNETDAFIQKMIRVSFKDCTILTIAHRLHTIIDSDKILVLDSGNLVEFDKPDNLLKKKGNESAVFKGLWESHNENQKQDH